LKKVRMVGEVYPTNVAQERWGGEGETLGDCLASAVDGMISVGDPYGEAQLVSLAPFAGDDPSHFLMFRFITLKDGYENFDHIDNGSGVVLKDYEVPSDPEPPEIIQPPIGDGSLLKQYQLPPGAKMLELKPDQR
jgi:hypothetical protein